MYNFNHANKVLTKEITLFFVFFSILFFVLSYFQLSLSSFHPHILAYIDTNRLLI